MNHFFKAVVITISLLCNFITVAQNTISKDTISSESVVVIKSFNPTINDAFKIKQEPSLEQDEEIEKPELNYTINSVAVPSTFTPQKTKPVELKKDKLPKQFDRYVLLGGGNYLNLNAEAFGKFKIDRSSELILFLNHLSSQGGIKEVSLNDHFYDTNLKTSFEKQNRYSSWIADLELHHQLYNWYGIPDESTFTTEQIESVNPTHSFIDANLGGKFFLDSKVVPTLSSRFRHFRDDYGSSENNLVVDPEFQFSFNRNKVKFPVHLDALFGSFDQTDILEQNTYGLVNFGIKPNFILDVNGASVQLGFSGFVSSDIENGSTKFFAYPNVKASYKIPQLNINLFGGVTGDLVQNSYHRAAEQNLFTAPSLTISPTNKIFNAYGGINGSVNSNFGYEAKISLSRDNNLPLWVKLPEFTFNDEVVNYGLNNAFTYVYDNVTTGSLSAKLDYEVENSFGLGLDATVYTYDTKDQLEAWNLPSVKAKANANYYFMPELNVTSYLFYTGSRKDIDQFTGDTVSLDGFFDVNIRGDYRINEQWQAFITGNNLLANSYQLWQDYPVQSIQVMVGAKYKF